MKLEQEQKLRSLAANMRKIAHAEGSQHAWWDIVFDLEDLVAGRAPVLSMSVEEWITYAEGEFEQHVEAKQKARAAIAGGEVSSKAV